MDNLAAIVWGSRAEYPNNITAADYNNKVQEIVKKREAHRAHLLAERDETKMSDREYYQRMECINADALVELTRLAMMQHLTSEYLLIPNKLLEDVEL